MTLRLALAALLVLLSPVAALAHGEQHGSAPTHLGGPFTIQGYRIVVHAENGPLEVGRESRVIAQIARQASEAPADGGDVEMGVAPSGAAITLQPVDEQTYAGSYTLTLTPNRSGPHQVRVAIAQLGGRPFTPPLTIDLEADVARRSGYGWLPLAAAALIAGAALVVGRMRAARPAEASLDLLAYPALARVLRSAGLLTVVQVTLLAATAVVVFLGIADVQDAGMNVAPRLAWTVWWAGVILTLVVAGRVWCAICPFGALNEWTSTLTGAWRRLPRVFRNIWWATAFFLVLTWMDEQLGVVRRPSVTAWLIIGIAVAAVVIGLRYERRSFCRYLCPIGGLFGLYAMVAPVELRAKAAAICRGHSLKECYHGGEGGRGRGCQMFEFPQTIDRNNYCTFCLECARGCSRDNIALRLRRVGADLWASAWRSMDEAYLAAMMVGLTLLVTARMLPAWPGWLSALARWLPPFVRTSFKPVTYLTVLESAVLLLGSLVVVPLLLLGAAAVSNRLAGGRAAGVQRTFIAFAYALIPVAVGLHLAHNFSHLLMEGSSIVPAVQRATAVFTPWSLGDPDWTIGALASGPVVSLLQFAAVLGFFVLSLMAAYRLSLRLYTDPVLASRAVLPIVLLSLLLTVAGIVVLGQPMAMRHGM